METAVLASVRPSPQLALAESQNLPQIEQVKRLSLKAELAGLDAADCHDTHGVLTPSRHTAVI